MRPLTIRLLAVLLCAALLLPFAGCQQDSPYDKGFRIPLLAEPEQLDPQVCADEASRTVVLSLFEGLTRLDENGRVVAGAASGWEIDKDGLVYTFTLGDGRWSDGTPVTAADFVYGFRRAVDPATGSALGRIAANIQGAAEILAGKAKPETLGVTAKDDRTLEIRLKKADDEWLYTLAFPPFMPCREDFFLSTNARYGLETEYVLGNGPFVLDRWSHGDSLLLIRSETYAAREAIYPERVRYMVTLTDGVPKNLANGTLDVGEITPEEVTAAEEAGARVVDMSDTVQYLWFNTTLVSLSQTAIRTALRDGIEWEGLPQALDTAGYSLATGYVAPEGLLADGTRYRNDENAMTFVSGGKDMADRLDRGLSAAGLSAMPTLTVLCAEDAASVNLAQYVIQCWQKNLGLYFRLETVGENTLRARMESGQYQIGIYACAAPGSDAPAALQAFMTGAEGNLSRFSDKSYDAAAKKAANTGDGVRALEQTLAASCPAVPLAFVRSYYAVAGNTEGIHIHAFDGGRFQVRYDFRQALKYED
ncbi:MAG: peptide ABC transporter substrate-binding protein [Clostridia bacterium]|nr:peptide ABC transporter substrate-binding protein [Clostridia bacterium]